MFFKWTDYSLVRPNPRPAYVRQLKEEPGRDNTDITHYGAVYNIKIKKEDTLMDMIEKLKVYRAELEAKKQSTLSADYSEAIEKEVIAYREALIKKAETERGELVKKIDSDIDCVNKLIEREEETVAVAMPEENVVTE